MDIIAFARQVSVSSLESAMTWESDEGSDNHEGNGSEDAVRGPVKLRTELNEESLHHPPMEMKKLRLDLPKAEVRKESSDPYVRYAQLRERPDPAMEDRIKQLKSKIKSMQQFSIIENDDDAPTPRTSKSENDTKKEMELPSNALKAVASKNPPQIANTPTSTERNTQNSTQVKQNMETNEEAPTPVTNNLSRSISKETESCLMESAVSGLSKDDWTPNHYENNRKEELYQNVTTSPLSSNDYSKDASTQSLDGAKEDFPIKRPSIQDSHRAAKDFSELPLVIPVDRMEDVSLMECDINSNIFSDFDDVESGVRRIARDNSSQSDSSEESSSCLERKKVGTDDSNKFFHLATTKAVELYGSFLTWIQDKQENFRSKPRNEKVVTVFIGLMAFILFILLFSLIAG
jgi:hypothetical protein